MNSNLYDVALSFEYSLNPLDKHALARYYHSTEAMYQAESLAIRNMKGRKLKFRRDSIEKATKCLRYFDEMGIGMVKQFDKNYPPLLKHIDDRPLLLYLRGDRSLLLSRTATIIGTREPAEEALVITKSITSCLVKEGYTIVSGLAKGIDMVAHQQALDEGGSTIAVLGCGIDRIYPAFAISIVRKMLDGNGLLLSEYPPGVSPYRFNFPVRNRIIAGLSKFTILIQAPLHSGTTITARLAGDYNRDVYIFKPKEECEGFEGNAYWASILPEEFIFSSVEEFEEKLAYNLKVS